MLSSVTVMRAPAGPDTTGTGATPGGPPGAPWAGAPAGGACAGTTGTEVGAPVGGGSSTGAEGPADLSQRNKTQHDVHALPRRIVFGCLFPEKIDRFANRSVTKFNMRNDDAIHLVGHLRGAAHFPSPFVVSGGADGAVFSDRLLPGFLYFPKLTGARLVVRFFAVLIFGVVDSFLPPARSSVVRIERQHPVVAFSSPCRTGRIDNSRRLRRAGVSLPRLY